MTFLLSWGRAGAHSDKLTPGIHPPGAEKEEETTVWKVRQRAMRDLNLRAGGWPSQGDPAQAKRTGTRAQAALGTVLTLPHHREKKGRESRST